MARDKIFDPAFQKAFTEAILKEKRLSAQWQESRGQRVPDSFDFDDAPDDDELIRSSPSRTPEKTARIETKDSVMIKKEDILRQIEAQTDGKDVDDIQLLQVMKPVALKTKKLLYKGLSHDDEGKAKYLRKRHNMDPEEKFNFPVCSSWEYGWTYGQDFSLRCPDHGRREIIRASFFRNNDPQLKPRR